jgi:hypothetical protein
MTLLDKGQPGTEQSLMHCQRVTLQRLIGGMTWYFYLSIAYMYLKSTAETTAA